MSNIRAELCEALDTTQKKKESDEAFVLRLSEIAQKLDSDAWEGLSTEAQEYMNAVTEADDNKTDIPLFPDEADANSGEDDAAEEAEEEGDEEMATEADDDKPTKKVAKKVAKKAPAKVDAKKASDEKPAKRASNGMMSAGMKMRLLVVKKPSLSVDALETELKKGGYAPSRATISATRQSTRDTLKALVRAGMLEIEL